MTLRDPRDVHVVPTWEPHDNTARDVCACHPTTLKTCEECEDDEDAERVCWKCDDSGLIGLDYPSEDVAAVVIHHAMTDPPNGGDRGD